MCLACSVSKGTKQDTAASSKSNTAKTGDTAFPIAAIAVAALIAAGAVLVARLRLD